MKAKAGKTVLITGATSGFGRHLAQAFLRAGFAVVAHGRDRKKLQALHDTVPKNKSKHFSIVRANLQEAKGLGVLRKVFREKNVEILINNAAVNPELLSGSQSLNMGEVRTIFLVNSVAAVILCLSAYEYFTKQDGGIVININSVAGLRGSSHEPVYAASKFGLRGFSESVKDAWWKKGIKMIDIYSGAIATGMSSKRSDVDELIDPQELAEFLVGLCKTGSFFAREINVQKVAKTHE